MGLWGSLPFGRVADSLGWIIDQILQNIHKQYVMFNFQKFFTPPASFLPLLFWLLHCIHSSFDAYFNLKHQKRVGFCNSISDMPIVWFEIEGLSVKREIRDLNFTVWGV